jgi:hypothetical protein
MCLCTVALVVYLTPLLAFQPGDGCWGTLVWPLSIIGAAFIATAGLLVFASVRRERRSIAFAGVLRQALGLAIVGISLAAVSLVLILVSACVGTVTAASIVAGGIAAGTTITVLIGRAARRQDGIAHPR